MISKFKNQNEVFTVWNFILQLAMNINTLSTQPKIHNKLETKQRGQNKRNIIS